MNKYIALLSALALGACMGGGSNGTGPAAGYVDSIRDSNSKITNMVSNSEYQITHYVANKLGDDAAAVNLGRGASSRLAFVPNYEPSGILDFDTVQELVELATWLVNDAERQDIVDTFNRSDEDKEKIKAALKLLDDMYCFVGGHADKTADRIIERRSGFHDALAELQHNTELFNMKDIKFKTIPTSGVISELRFNVNPVTGRIESIEYKDAEAIMAAHSGSEVPVGPLMRSGDSNVFIERATITETDSQYYGQEFDLPHEYVSYARQLGLSYADFGVLRTDTSKVGIPELAEVWGVYETPFVGGYTTKQVADDRMTELAAENDVVFNGLARGTVSYHDWDAGIGGADIALAGGLNDDNATLAFSGDGKQTLSADFTNWARIRAVKSNDGTNQLFVDDIYVPNTSPYYLEDSPAGLTEDMSGEHSMVFETGYYGDNNNPTEAVGLVQYQRQWTESGPGHWVQNDDGGWNEELQQYGYYDNENHINLDLGFGGTIVQQPAN